MPTGASGDEQHALDSTFALSDDGGESFKVPRQLLSAAIDEDRGCLTSSWTPWPDVLVETWLVAPSSTSSSLAWHIRAHRVTLTDAQAPRELLVSDGTFAVSDRERQGERRRVEAQVQVGADRQYTSDSEAFVAAHRGAVGIRDITPDLLKSGNGTRGVVVPNDASSNIIAPRTSIACLQKTLSSSSSSSRSHVLVTAVFAVVPRDENVGLTNDEIDKAWNVDVTTPDWLHAALRKA